MKNLILGRAAEACLAAGRVDEAARLVEQAAAFAERGRAPHYRALARRVEGDVLLARGRHDEALRVFDSALAEFRRLGSRLEAARALHHRAGAGIASGRIAAARSDAVAARDAFAAIGAAPDRARAQRLLENELGP